MGQALDHVLCNPGIWRGGKIARAGRQPISTGYSQLDQALPDRGWSVGALTEILTRDEGIGELSLLVPALRHLSRPVVLITPPYLPFAPAWETAGVRLDRLLAIKTDGTEALWAAEQALRSGMGGMVLVWSRSQKAFDYRTLQRLNMAASQGAAACMLYRPVHVGSAPSPAPLRLLLSAVAGELSVSILKRRGVPLPTPICINLYPNWHPHASAANICSRSIAAPADATVQSFPR